MFNRIVERLRSADHGYGLVEIVVAMFMMALLAIAFLPLLIQGIQTSHRNKAHYIAVADSLRSRGQTDLCPTL